MTDLANPVDMITGTGIRAGEVFALRWEARVHEDTGLDVCDPA